MTQRLAKVPEKEELRTLLAEVIDVDVALIEDHTSFVEDLGVDSLIALELVVVLEKKFGVRFAEPEMRKVATVQDTYDLLLAKLSAGTA
jgi:acyl carrier protein